MILMSIKPLFCPHCSGTSNSRLLPHNQPKWRHLGPKSSCSMMLCPHTPGRHTEVLLGGSRPRRSTRRFDLKGTHVLAGWRSRSCVDTAMSGTLICNSDLSILVLKYRTLHFHAHPFNPLTCADLDSSSAGGIMQAAGTDELIHGS